MEQSSRTVTGWIRLTAWSLMLAGPSGFAAGETETQQQVRQLQKQNEALQQQLQRQQAAIDELLRKVSVLEASRASVAGDDDTTAKGEADESARASSRVSFGKVHLRGEGALALFHSESQGAFPNSEFRVDEAKLFVEAPILGDAYFFTELNLFLRESGSPNVRVGELYLDFENLSRVWGKDRQLNLRAGRFDTPFGEEYLSRDALDNPLISHSLMDFWGVDEGVEVYGAFGMFQYVMAVQNGGRNALRDFNSDKAVIARVGADPAKWLHVSVSAMRTGELDVDGDESSELWLGQGLVRSLGSGGTTVFEANLLQADAHLKFLLTTIKAAGGVLQYEDNDPAADNRREVYHYSIEAEQTIHRGLYAAARWSQAFARDGFPLAGNGNADPYYEDVLTKRLWLLSLGVGYRWNKSLALKTEYSFSRGREADGTPRHHEDLFAVQAAFGF